MLFQEHGHDFGHEFYGERWNHAHAQRPFGPYALETHLIDGLLHDGVDDLRGADQDLAELVELGSASSAVEDLHAEASFQLCDAIGECRLRDPLGGGGAIERAMFRNAQEIGEIAGIDVQYAHRQHSGVGSDTAHRHDSGGCGRENSTALHQFSARLEQKLG
jgi:hypothetical protein